MSDIKHLIHEPYEGWLDEFVTTTEAAKITGVPESTLTTMRSRGGGPNYVIPKHTRIVRYQRRALFEWMFSGGIKKFTEDLSDLITPPHADNDNVEDA